MAKIYTKTGDHGKTRLVGGCLVTKSDPRIHAYGTVDELNSQIGLIRYSLLAQVGQYNAYHSLNLELKRIQNELFNLGSLLACESEEWFHKMPALHDQHISHLEKSIDTMTEQLKPLKNFILPAGSLPSSYAHVARTICRRAERHTVELYTDKNLYEKCFQYLNRLSDYLFVLARYCNHIEGIADHEWEK